MLTRDDVVSQLERHEAGAVTTRELVRWLDDAVGDDLIGDLSADVQEALLDLQDVTALYVPGTPESHAYYVGESAVRSAVKRARTRVTG